MAIDILNIAPTTVSRDLRGKYVLLYGKPKSGKTTAASQFPKALLCAFEKGYNAIGGIRPVDITKWAEFKLVIKQLEKPEARQAYDTIIIDTVSIAYDYCEQYICQQNGVQSIGDIQWGGGYSAAKKEFDTTLRKISMLGYGIVLIAHNASRIEKLPDGNEREIISPDMPKRAAEICNGLVDIIGYIGNEYVDGETRRYLYTRETPTLFAGSRFKYLSPKIPFGYTQLVDAIGEAIDMQEQKDGITVVEKSSEAKVEVLDYDALMAEAKDIWMKLVKPDSDAPNAEVGKRILKKIEIIFGHATKLSEITEDQVDLLNLVVIEMREMLG